MHKIFIIERFKPGEEQAVSELVRRIFDEFVAPGTPGEGHLSFYAYIEPSALLQRQYDGQHFLMTAKQNGAVIGAVEMRDCAHVSLLFVDKRYHHRHIGRQLFEAAVERALRSRPEVREITAHSSLYAVPAYERLGFRREGDELLKHGIPHVPMKMPVTRE